MAYLWSQHPGMLLVTPTTACAGWRIHDSSRAGGELKVGLSDGDKTLESMRYVWMANFLGMPSISVPAGYVDTPAPATGIEGVVGGGISTVVSKSKDQQPDQQQDAGKGGVDDYERKTKGGKIPVGLMATGEWAGEKALVEFGVAAERVGMRWRERPAAWVDVVGLAREERDRSD